MYCTGKAPGWFLDMKCFQVATIYLLCSANYDDYLPFSARVLPLAPPLLAALLAQKALQCARQASALRGNAEMGDEVCFTSDRRLCCNKHMHVQIKHTLYMHV